MAEEGVRKVHSICRICSERTDFFAKDPREQRMITVPPIPNNQKAWIPTQEYITPCQQTDPEIFFSPNADDIRAAKRACGMCEVQADCLVAGINQGEISGIWGGRSFAKTRYY